jgi:hypothetical protein
MELLWEALRAMGNKPKDCQQDWISMQFDYILFHALTNCFVVNPGTSYDIQKTLTTVVNALSKMLAIAAKSSSNTTNPTFVPVVNLWVDILRLARPGSELPHFETFVQRAKTTMLGTHAPKDKVPDPISAEWLHEKIGLLRPHFVLFQHQPKRPPEEDHEAQNKRLKQDLTDAQDDQQHMLNHVSKQSDHIDALTAQVVAAGETPVAHPNA